MAYFSARELLDVVRHEMRCEDDTNDCSRVILPPIRRAKYGGFPLGFRCGTDDDGDDLAPIEYKIPLNSQSFETRSEIEAQLKSRGESNDHRKKAAKGKFNTNEDPELYIPRSNIHSQTSQISALTTFVTENAAILLNPLNEFNQYQTLTGNNLKAMTVFFGDTPEENRLSCNVKILPTTRVFQVIGLCCLKYLQMTGKDPAPVEEYDLKITEETGEIEDFPPLERGRKMGDLNFPFLTLLRNTESGSNQEKATVYFTSGQIFDIIVPSFDRSFQWLCDEAIRLLEEQTNFNRDGMLLVREHRIEDLDGKTWSMEAPLSLSGSREFVMIRKNSSRGDFDPRPRPSVMMRPQSLPSHRQLSVALSLSTPGTSGRFSGLFDMSNLNSPQERIPPTPLTTQLVDENYRSCFVVERLHRIKPKWSANLVVEWSRLELTPSASDSERRKSFIPQGYQKPIFLPWEYVCQATIGQKERGKEVFTVTISWLPPIEGCAVNDLTLENLSLLDSNHRWKTIQVECRSREDCFELSNSMNTMMQAKESAVRQAWDHSQSGQLKPSSAAGAALLMQRRPSFNQNSSSQSDSSKQKKKFRDFTRTLISGLQIRKRSQAEPNSNGTA